MSNKFFKRDYIIFFSLYSISYFLLLLNFDGLYWDDWAVYNQSLETKEIFFSQFKNIVLYNFHIYFLSLENSIVYYRIFVFSAYFISAIFINNILKNIKELSSKDIFYITLLYLIMPVISSRIAISIIPFFLPLVVFYATFYLLTLYLRNELFPLRVIVLVGFYLSFYTNSILVFYALVLMYIYYIRYGVVISIKNIKKFIIKYYDFIVLPIIFFLVKVIYFKPEGIYSGYNSVGNTSIFKIAFNLLKSIDTSVFNVLHQALYISLPYWLLLALIIYMYKKYFYNELNYAINNKSKYLFILGLIIFLLAVFPYIAVSKLPQVDSFSSRFQLLTPLGLAFIFYFGINLIVKYFKLNIFVKQVLCIILIFSFIGKNIYDYYRFQIDSMYMTSVMLNIKDNNIIKQNTTFILNNNINAYLAYHRNPPLYEWNGLSKKVFGDDNRLFLSYKQYRDFKDILKIQSQKQYNFSTWKKDEPIVVFLSYNYQKKRKSNSKRAKLFSLKFKDYDKYLKDVKSLTYVTTLPLSMHK